MIEIDWVFWVSLIVFVFFFFMGVVMMMGKLYRKVVQGQAMIVNTMGKTKVTFSGSLVFPVIHKMEIMDISLKTIEIDRHGTDGLICKDNIRADIKVAFFVRVNKTRDDVLQVAQTVGCERASSQETLEELFSAKFSEALKTVGKALEFSDLYTQRNVFRDKIIENIGSELNGYELDNLAIDYLEQTPIDKLDPRNILDADGRRKITKLTAEKNIETNELQRDEEMKIKRQDVEAREALLELDRQQADAEAKTAREIATLRSREQAETEKVEHEERQKAEQARLQMEQNVGVQEQNKQREVEVAAQNRYRVIAEEKEKVQKAQELAAVDREKEVSLQTIANEKLVEIERKEIASVVRERKEMEKTVAQTEEETKELRLVAEAVREKKVQVIKAEAEAEEDLVKEVKAAEAAEKKATFEAREKTVLAQAALEVAEKNAEAKRRQAEGTEATEAASGLAEAKVMEAKAGAEEQKGMVEVRVEEAKADAKEKTGLAEAKILAEKMAAEADGMQKKFVAMASMSNNQQNHEEFRMQLETSHRENIESISANVEVAKEQATVLAAALRDANIDIVGGDTAYFDSFVKSLSVGKAIDGVVNKSKLLSTEVQGYLSGDASFVSDAKEILASLGGASQELQNISVTAFLAKLLSGRDAGESRKVIDELQKAIEKTNESTD